MFKLSDFNVTRKEARLSNGVRLVVFERPNTPVSMSVLFLAGARFDPLGKDGLAHFLEHMVMSGNKRFPTSDKYFEFIERLGGGINAYTGTDIQGIEVSIGDSSDLEEVYKVISEILFNPLFKKESFQREKDTILKEIGRKESSPGSKLIDVTKTLVFQDTLVGRSILGTKTTLKSITRKDIVGGYRDMFVAERAAIIVCGGIKLKFVKELSEKYLNLSSGRGDKFEKDLVVKRKKCIKIGLFGDINQIHLSLSFRATRNFHPDRVVLSVISGVLGGSHSSVLSRKLRIERGLVYSVSAGTRGFIDGGAFGVSTSTSKKNVQQVLDIIVEEISRIVEDGVTEEEIQTVKERRLKSTKLGMQTSRSWVNKHDYRSLMQQDKVWTLEDYFEDLEKVKVSDVKNVAKKYFKPDGWYLAMCGDISEKDVKVDY